MSSINSQETTYMKLKIQLFGIPIDALTMEQTVNLIGEKIATKESTSHVVINAAKVVAMQKDKMLFKSVVESTIINADGQSIVWASKFLGRPLPGRVAGIDLMESLVELAYKYGYSCYFLGAKKEVVQKVVDHYSLLYSPAVIAGYRNGYFNKEEEEDIARNIASSGANILFVAITSPHKEIFLNNYKKIINTPFIMGVGGSFDIIAGVTKRAPRWMQKSGFEWFYRFLQEPKRMWRRYLIGNAKFILLIISQKLGLYKNPFDTTSP